LALEQELALEQGLLREPPPQVLPVNWTPEVSLAKWWSSVWSALAFAGTQGTRHFAGRYQRRMMLFRDQLFRKP
jgi:hypothetical protein